MHRNRNRVDDYEALANFRYLLRKFLRFSKDFLRANGNLSPEQYEASLASRAFTSIGGLTISQLSERSEAVNAPMNNVTPKSTWKMRFVVFGNLPSRAISLHTLMTMVVKASVKNHPRWA